MTAEEHVTNLKQKFYPGDYAYFLYPYRDSHSITCPKCHGEHSLLVTTEEGKRIKVTCPYCSGEDVPIVSYFVCEAYVYETLHYADGKVIYSVRVDGDVDFEGVVEDDLFASNVDAAKEVVAREKLAEEDAMRKFEMRVEELESECAKA